MLFRSYFNMYKKEYVQTFLEKQGQLFDEPVAEDFEEAEEFLEDCMAVVLDSLKDVKKYLDGMGADGWGHLRFVYPSFRRSRISGLFPDRTELCSEKEREIKNNPRNVMPAIDVSPNIRI